MKISKNIRKIAIFTILASMDLFSAIEVAFFFSKGLTASQTYMIYSIFSVLIVILEVPTGFVGDKIGYKNSIALGLGMGGIGFCGFLFSKGFWGIMASYFLMALMNAFISGADDALLYDTLKEENRDNDFEKIYARIASYAYFSSIVGSVLGGIIAGLSMNADVIVQLAFLIAGFTVLVGIKKKKQVANEEDKIGIDVVDKNIKTKSVALTLVLAGFFMTSTLIGTKFSQQVMLSVDIPLSFFGVFTAMLTVVASLFSYIATKLNKVPFSVIILAPSLVLIMIGISGNGNFIILLIIISACRAIGNIRITTLINVHISSKYRATINSVKNLLFRLFYAIIIFSCGKVADYSIFMAVLVSGVVLALSLSVCLIVKRRLFYNPVFDSCKHKKSL